MDQHKKISAGTCTLRVEQHEKKGNFNLCDIGLYIGYNKKSNVILIHFPKNCAKFLAFICVLIWDSVHGSMHPNLPTFTADNNSVVHLEPQ